MNAIAIRNVPDSAIVARNPAHICQFKAGKLIDKEECKS